MTFQTEELQPLIISGKKIRTKNEIEMREDRIANFWKEFMSTNILSIIKGKKADQVMYGVYYDYESNMDGEYSFMLGTKITDQTIPQPEGISTIKIPKQKYAVFIADGLHEIRNTWKTIWSTDLKRTYRFDFEIYTPNSNQVKIYISVL